MLTPPRGLMLRSPIPLSASKAPGPASGGLSRKNRHCSFSAWGLSEQAILEMGSHRRSQVPKVGLFPKVPWCFVNDSFHPLAVQGGTGSVLVPLKPLHRSVINDPVARPVVFVKKSFD